MFGADPYLGISPSRGGKVPGLPAYIGMRFFFNACEIIFDRLVLAEVTAEAFLVQIRFKAENFLCDFLIFSLYPLQFSLSLVKVQALCFEFNVRN